MSENSLRPDGERFLPEFKGTIELEHLHRYQLARTLAAGMDVLDIACGEGYGSKIIAATANTVVGVDISADAVSHAAANYNDPKLTFRVGSATKIPLADASVDMIVSFETIEHLEDHDRMMMEFRRVLRPSGLALISSPSKLEYSDKPGYSNPFHVRELYTQEFVDLVSRYFAHSRRYGQRLSAASLIAQDDIKAHFQMFSGSEVRPGVPDSRYDIILASDGNIPELPHSAYEIPTSPLQPYAVEAAQKALQGEIAASGEVISELSRHVVRITEVANNLLESKWWRLTRSLRRLSNSIRKRRGLPKKKWPDRVELPAVAQQMQSVDMHQAVLRSYATSESVISPFGRSYSGADIPVVPYSSVSEQFVAYEQYEPVESAVGVIAFYLPQFHPFPQNDKWWGKGFTEWTNVGKARPLFSGHNQPHCPIHLGYYDLRVPDVMREQVKLARNYGISGFAYYFYWFAGQLLMERPLEAMLADNEVDLPFCMIWANENWTRRWDGLDHEVLIAQDHSIEDSRAMFSYLKKFMQDERYIRVNGLPLFIVYRASIIPDLAETIAMWRREAEAAGLGGLYIVSAQTFGHLSPLEAGLDAAIEFPPHGVKARDITSFVRGLAKDFSGAVYDYPEVVSGAVKLEDPEYMLYRTAMLGWDNTARRGLKASMFADFSVTRYSQWLSSNIERTAKDPSRTDSERLVFVNAWNEWAEGTHLEPDQKHGYGYLEATRSVVANYPMGSDRFFRPDIPDITSRRFAVVVHLHYADTWDELKAAILRLSDVDIYVTVTSAALAQVVCADMPSAVIEIMDNRGRDVRPFLHMMKRISHLKYRAVCKVHGKKSVYRMDGDNLRSKLISTLLDPSVIEKFDSNDRLGMVATASSLIPHNQNNMHTNSEQVHDICEEIAVPFVSGRFVAGTMFWVDPRAIEPLVKLRTNDFDVERGLVDGTRAHAIERLFCVVCEARGFEIAEV